MRKESREFLTRYLNNSSPTSFEASGQKLWLDYVKPWIDDYLVDPYGSVVGIVNPDAEYKVVIEAHADEISWYVSNISDKGYIYVTRNGGKGWRRLDDGLPRSQAWWTVKRQAMTSDAQDPLGLYFGTTSGELWTSRDEGARWACMARHLPEIYAVETATLR